MTNEALYPAIEPYKTGYLQVSPVHQIYYEEVGNPHGKPILFIHGGPGGKIMPKSRRYFDPAFYRVILFDQRGTGNSQPICCLEENTTWHLVDDIEKLRIHLNIAKWAIFGGSWGSTLGLTYAIMHPNAVLAIILRGVFLSRQKELTWLYQHGASMLRPREWEAFQKPIPETERDDMLHAYHRRLTSNMPEKEKFKLAKVWNQWETDNAYLFPPEQKTNIPPKTEEQIYQDNLAALSLALIETHYFINHSFYENDDWILNNIVNIHHIPCYIAQGQYDTVCPAISAWELQKYYPLAQITFVQDGGHAGSIGNMAVELVRFTNLTKSHYR
jgi:proline iminopeptidase